MRILRSAAYTPAADGAGLGFNYTPDFAHITANHFFFFLYYAPTSVVRQPVN